MLSNTRNLMVTVRRDRREPELENLLTRREEPASYLSSGVASSRRGPITETVQALREPPCSSRKCNERESSTVQKPRSPQL